MTKREPIKREPSFSIYFPALNPELLYTGMHLEKPEQAIATGSVVTLSDKFMPIQYLQNPYTDIDLKRLEAAARRNWAVRSAFGVREHFTFSKGSELMIELAPSETEGLGKEEQAKKIESNKDWQAALKVLTQQDKDLRLIEILRTFYWQMLVFGRGCIIRYEDEGEKIHKLQVINSRRLGDVIVERETQELKGVFVDGQPIGIRRMIYTAYNDLQLSPHTEFYGYSAIETIMHVAETLNITVEEDWKEIMKSAWLAQILLHVNTQGLSPADAKTKITTLIDAIKPGKIIGTSHDTSSEMLDLKPNFEGLVRAVDKMEQIIYKALYVPQFLVQNEGVANRATAVQSAQLFVDGIVSFDQEVVTAALTNQWYEPELRKALKLTDPDKPVPFRIKRVFNRAKIAEFIDLAEAVVALITAGVWDRQKANEVLGSEDVIKRMSEGRDGKAS